MSTQAALFDAKEGEKLKRQGMERAQSARAEVLSTARAFAITIASHKETREATIDEIYEYMAAYEKHPELLCNAAGSVFDGDRWEFTGRWVKSKRTTNHGRMIRVWRLK